MNQRAAEREADANDPLVRDMRVQRVEREDGRYLLYYFWPEDQVEQEREIAHHTNPVDRDV